MTDKHPVADIKHRIEHHRYERGKEHRAEQPPDSLVSEIEPVSVHNNNILIWQSIYVVQNYKISGTLPNPATHQRHSWQFAKTHRMLRI
jgi:hypothetical protein